MLFFFYFTAILRSEEFLQPFKKRLGKIPKSFLFSRYFALWKIFYM